MCRSYYFVFLIIILDLVKAHSSVTTGYEYVEKHKPEPRNKEESKKSEASKEISKVLQVTEANAETSEIFKVMNEANDEDASKGEDTYGDEDEGQPETDDGDDNENSDENEDEYDNVNGDENDDEDGYGNDEVQYSYDDDPQNDEPDNGEESDGAMQDNIQTRSLQAGDTFTPYEMLPISNKLLSKVDTPGEGRGIVSSAKSAEDLADKLFAAYFLTTKRIVYLNEIDLSGLDALQALALEGDVVKMRSLANSVTEATLQTVNYRGQLIGIDNIPRRCHYKLVSKKVTPTKGDLRSGRTNLKPFTKILKIEKNMRPDRHLIVNYSRKLNKENQNLENKYVMAKKQGNEKRKRNKIGRHRKNKTKRKKGRKGKTRQNRKLRQKKRGVKRNQKLKQRKRQGKKKHNANLSRQNRLMNKVKHDGILTTTLKPSCKWRYICKDPGNMDTCRLHTSCYTENGNKPKNEYPDHKGKENNQILLQFRKMLGITALDEEVEKIIEQHVLLVKPDNMHGVDKIETLDEYFNKIIIAQHALKGTTPSSNTEDEHKDDSVEQHPMVKSKENMTYRPNKFGIPSVEFLEKDKMFRNSQNKKAKGRTDGKLRVGLKSTPPTVSKVTKKLQ